VLGFALPWYGWGCYDGRDHRPPIGVARRARRQALAAGPLIGLLGSPEDTEDTEAAAWVRAGLAWQRLALAAHLSGLAVAPLTAVVDNPGTRQAAAAHAPAGQHLQVLFRLGRSPGPLPPTARRDPAWTAPPVPSGSGPGPLRKKIISAERTSEPAAATPSAAPGWR
jgi:hypothetical protein